MMNFVVPNPSNPPQTNPGLGGIKGGGIAAAVMIASPFVSVALVNRMIYGVQFMDRTNLIVPAAVLAGNIIPVPFAGVATGIAAGSYIAGLPMTESVVLVLGGTAMMILLDLTVFAALLKENVPSQ